MSPRWAKLVDKWRQEGNLGVTPSFLIGALRTPVGVRRGAQASYAELYELMKSMASDQAPYGKVARVFECHNLLQPVVTLSDDTRGSPISGASLPVRLYVWPWKQPERAVDFDWLLQTLWCHFRESICEGQFFYDRRTKSFSEFTTADHSFIKRALVDDGEDET